jgi:hypothetical protein
MSQLTANDLKTRGVAAIESLLASQPEAMISVRGKDRYVVMDLAHYHYLRECELDAALAQSQADIAAGRFVAESATAHVARISTLARISALASAPANPVKKPAHKSVNKSVNKSVSKAAKKIAA